MRAAASPLASSVAVPMSGRQSRRLIVRWGFDGNTSLGRHLMRYKGHRRHSSLANHPSNEACFLTLRSPVRVAA